MNSAISQEQPTTAAAPVHRQRIVVGVDGSPASVDALQWAVRQASLTGSTVEALTSWHFPAQYGNEFLGEQVDWREVAETIVSNTLALLSPEESEHVSSRVAEGHPAQVLTEASAQADLLVVGSRGHGGFAGMLLGSVSEYVIAHAHCPVLVTRHRT